MILIDSSVWIDHLRGKETPAVSRLQLAVDRDEVLVGDLILLEILLGARDRGHAKRLEKQFSGFPKAAMLSQPLVPTCAENYRLLRSHGVTMRKTIDVIIGTFCIENDIALLHQDRDFSPMVQYLGLKLA